MKRSLVIFLAATVFLLLSPRSLAVTRGDEQRARVVQLARQLVGRPYVYGTDGPRTFDCSGLVRWIYGKTLGRWLPHNAAVQYYTQRRIHGRLRPGDLLFFYGLGHVGLYIGNGLFIQASSSAGRVIVSRLRDYRWVLDGERRVIATW